MAGYIFNLDSTESLRLYVTKGVYATKLSTPHGRWKTHHEATFADYTTMKPGDNVYFFIDRKIYGVGEMVSLKGDCKFSNFPEACIPNAFNYREKRDLLLWDEGNYSKEQRWICVFKPSPYFFTSGIDMDDALASNPKAFKMLRAFWKVSFIKFDDAENQAFKDVILKFNQDALKNPITNKNIFANDQFVNHNAILAKIKNGGYGLNLTQILQSCTDENYINHEMALEASILYQLSYEDNATIAVFGNWDYLSHQVIASPFKPIDYMDKMDIFGYSFITGFSPTKSKYLVVELKKGDTIAENIEQLLKYVDWVKDEYCFGDYSAIHAFLVAYNFSEEIIRYKNENARRRYIVGRRPARSLEWINLKLVKYSYNSYTGKVDFGLLA